MPTAAPISYLALVRKHRTFRRIWMGDVVSLTGDWFTTISLFALLLELTGRGEAVAFALIARFLPSLILGPVAGVVADRLDRRVVLVTCDVLRACVVLGFLLVRTPSDVPLAYALAFLQASIAAFFDPAEQAAIGTTVDRDEVVAANALQGATWSAMLAIGASLGGLFAQLAGRDAAFVANAVTYLVSAGFMASAAIPRQPRVAGSASLRSLVGVDDVVDALRFFAREPGVRRVLFAKAGWGIAGGGAILMYSVYGERVFPLAGGAATGIGVLYAARGVGALIGPTIARHAFGESERALDRTIGLCFVLLGFAYALFGAAPWLWLAALALVFAHVGASTLWSFSTSLLNLRVPDRLRGRAFAADLAAQTLTMAASTWAAGYGLDHLGVGPRPLMGVLAVLMIVPTIVWQVLPKGPPHPEQAPAVPPKPEMVEPG